MSHIWVSELNLLRVGTRIRALITVFNNKGSRFSFLLISIERVILIVQKE